MEEEKKKSNKRKLLWLSVLILFICVALTTCAVMEVMNVFQPDDSGAISIRPDTPGVEDCPTDGPTTPNDTTENDSQTTAPPVTPGLDVYDDQTVWQTNTQIELFKVSYQNGQRVVTVVSDKGDKIIAPGTGNSYTFKLKNAGNVALDYTVEVEVFFTPSDVEIPITMRLSRYDGNWVVGGKKSYIKASEMGIASDTDVLGAGRYAYYTLDWSWPLEGDDDLDTMLGDMAAEQDLTFTIVIRTVATECSDPNAEGGLLPPKTGDETNITFWIALIAGSFGVIIILLIMMKRENKRTDVEADKLEGTQRE